MDTILNNYLEKVDKYLKPMPASERVDIVKEIKSEMVELQSAEGLSSEKIVERLGNPKELAKAYLGDVISNGTGLSWSRVLTICAFYSVVGFSGLIVIPTLAIVAPVFILCAVLTPLLGTVKLIDHLFNLNIPYAEHIGFQFGTAILSPIPVFFLSIVTGVILYFIGRGAWKLLIYYIKKVSTTKRTLSI